MSSTNAKAMPCRFFQQGHCTRRDWCPYLHIPADGPPPSPGPPGDDSASASPTTQHAPPNAARGAGRAEARMFVPAAQAEMRPGAGRGRGGASRGDRDTAPGVCRFFQRGFCNRGDACSFLHVSSDPAVASDAPPSDGSSSAAHTPAHTPTQANAPRAEQPDTRGYVREQAEGRGRGRGRGSWAREPRPENGTGGPSPCKFFQRGFCSRGDACRFQHVAASAAARWPPPPKKGGAKAAEQREQGGEEQEPADDVEETATTTSTLEEDDDDEPDADADVDADAETRTRAIGGGNGTLSVEFGAGLSVAVCDANASSSIAIDELPFDASVDDLQQLLSAIKADIDPDAIRIVKLAETAYATINLGDPATAQRAVHELDGKPHGESTLQVKLQRPASDGEDGGAPSQDATHVSCSWFAAARIGHAHFSTYEDAQAAAAHRFRMIRGRRAECKLQGSTARQNGSFSVSLRGLDPRTTEQDVKKSMRCETASLEPPSYSLSETEAVAQVRSLLEDDDNHALESLTLVSPANAGKPKAIVRFSTAQHARQAVTHFGGKKPSFLGNSPLHLALVFTALFKIPARIYAAIKDDVAAITRQGHADGYIQAKVSDAQAALVAVRIFGPDRRALAHIKASVQRVLLGELLHDADDADAEAAPLWDPYFVSNAGKRAVDAVMTKSKTHIYCDARNRRVAVYGAPAGRTQACAALRKELQRFRSQRQVLQLDSPAAFRAAVKFGLDKVRELLGNKPVSADAATKQLLFQGSADDLDAVTKLLADLPADETSEAPQNGEEEEEDEKKEGVKDEQKESEEDGECALCFKPASASASAIADSPSSPSSPSPPSPTPRRADCGHTYHLHPCLRDHLLTTVLPSITSVTSVTNPASPSPQLPLTCTLCTHRLPLPLLRSAIRERTLQTLCDAALAVFVHRHPRDYRFCPTADCYGIYAVPDAAGGSAGSTGGGGGGGGGGSAGGSAGENAEGNAANVNGVLMCTVCKVDVCALCGVEAHDGLVCAEYAALERGNGNGEVDDGDGDDYDDGRNGENRENGQQNGQQNGY